MKCRRKLHELFHVVSRFPAKFHVISRKVDYLWDSAGGLQPCKCCTLYSGAADSPNHLGINLQCIMKPQIFKKNLQLNSDDNFLYKTKGRIWIRQI